MKKLLFLLLIVQMLVFCFAIASAGTMYDPENPGASDGPQAYLLKIRGLSEVEVGETIKLEPYYERNKAALVANKNGSKTAPAVGSAKITFLTSNASVATVSKDGTVKGIKKGSVIISAQDNDGRIKNKKVTITAPSIKIDEKVSLKVGSTHQLNVTTSGQGDIAFKSSNKAIATVNIKGLITAKKAGDCIITATYRGMEAQCQVHVNETPGASNTDNEGTISASTDTLISISFGIGRDKVYANYRSDGKVLISNTKPYIYPGTDANIIINASKIKDGKEIPSDIYIKDVTFGWGNVLREGPIGNRTSILNYQLSHLDTDETYDLYVKAITSDGYSFEKRFNYIFQADGSTSVNSKQQSKLQMTFCYNNIAYDTYDSTGGSITRDGGIIYVTNNPTIMVIASSESKSEKITGMDYSVRFEGANTFLNGNFNWAGAVNKVIREIPIKEFPQGSNKAFLKVTIKTDAGSTFEKEQELNLVEKDFKTYFELLLNDKSCYSYDSTEGIPAMSEIKPLTDVKAGDEFTLKLKTDDKGFKYAEMNFDSADNAANNSTREENLNSNSEITIKVPDAKNNASSTANDILHARAQIKSGRTFNIDVPIVRGDVEGEYVRVKVMLNDEDNVLYFNTFGRAHEGDSVNVGAVKMGLQADYKMIFDIETTEGTIKSINYGIGSQMQGTQPSYFTSKRFEMPLPNLDEGTYTFMILITTNSGNEYTVQMPIILDGQINDKEAIGPSGDQNAQLVSNNTAVASLSGTITSDGGGSAQYGSGKTVTDLNLKRGNILTLTLGRATDNIAYVQTLYGITNVRYAVSEFPIRILVDDININTKQFRVLLRYYDKDNNIIKDENGEVITDVIIDAGFTD